jgi:hypothetical protein
MTWGESNALGMRVLFAARLRRSSKHEPQERGWPASTSRVLRDRPEIREHVNRYFTRKETLFPGHQLDGRKVKKRR